MTLSPGARLRTERPADVLRVEVAAFAECLVLKTVDTVVERKRLAREARIASLDAGLQSDSSFTPDGSEQLVFDVDAENLRNRPGSTRGEVTGWSPKSRLRLMFRLASVPRGAVGRMTMLTLTYDGSWWKTGAGVWRTPAVVKSELEALRKRLERAYGPMVGIWKMETQERGAPHFHVGIRMPDVDGDRRAQKTADREFADFARSAWHDIVCHDGAARPCTCYHRAFGAQMDLGYADRIRNGRSTLAAYFSKHGTWASKEYQHETPGSVIRRALVAVQVFAPLGGTEAGDPVPRSQFSGKRKIVTVWRSTVRRTAEMAEWEVFADSWDNPGRWWGVWRLPVEPLAEVTDLRQLTEGDSEDASRLLWRVRLLCRKLVRRRTQRLVVLDESMRHCYVSRTLLSLHGFNDSGFRLMAKDGEALLRWLLRTALSLMEVEGRPLAVALSVLELPVTEPQRLKRAAVAVSASCNS